MLKSISSRLDGSQGAFKQHSFLDSDFFNFQSHLDGFLGFAKEGARESHQHASEIISLRQVHMIIYIEREEYLYQAPDRRE